MQNQCQINYARLFCEKSNVAMNFFAFNMRLQKLSTKKRKSENEIIDKENARDNCEGVVKQKDIEYYFREVRFDPSHAAVWTNVQHCKLLTYHHAYYLLP